MDGGAEVVPSAAPVLVTRTSASELLCPGNAKDTAAGSASVAPTGAPAPRIGGTIAAAATATAAAAAASLPLPPPVPAAAPVRVLGVSNGPKLPELRTAPRVGPKSKGNPATAAAAALTGTAAAQAPKTAPAAPAPAPAPQPTAAGANGADDRGRRPGVQLATAASGLRPAVSSIAAARSGGVR